jgi:hypothetical protein
MSDETDKELSAIQAVMTALDGLDDAARRRALGYVFERLGIRGDLSRGSVAAPPLSLDSGRPTVETPPPAAPAGESSGVADIRTLKEAKKPKSANEMAALVAFYVAELAPERRDTITRKDVETYFKQARFPLPSAMRQTLPNAAAAGYLDFVSDGEFRLNPVGYNLVAHSLPRDGSASSTGSLPGPRRRAKAKRGAGSTRKLARKLKN